MDKHDPRRQPTEAELDDVNSHWADSEDDGKTFDPNRGDRVDHLNDTTPPPPPPKYPRTERRKKRRWPLVLVLVLLLAAAGGAYYHFGMKKAAAPAKAPTTSQNTTPLPKPSATTPTKHYDSTNFALGLDYPETWKVNDETAKLTITSPRTSLTDATGKTVEGYLQVNVQNKQTTLPAFAKGSAQAVLESEKLTYKQPTPSQRAQTYISFDSYASDTANGLDAIYVTGDNGYKVGQGIPMADAIQTNPLVTVVFLNCADQTCAGVPKALSVSPTNWKDTAVSTPIKAIIQSFSFD